MTCKECIHNAVCYLRNYCITSDYANKCGYYFSDNVIDDIKAEIENEADFCECMPYGKCMSPRKVIEIIDKHISGKERMNDTNRRR